MAASERHTGGEGKLKGMDKGSAESGGRCTRVVWSDGREVVNRSISTGSFIYSHAHSLAEPHRALRLLRQP